MEKNIAIKGNNRIEGTKIIKYLETIGGINDYNLKGELHETYYYINYDFYNRIQNISLKALCVAGYKCYDSIEEYEKSLTINYTDI